MSLAAQLDEAADHESEGRGFKSVLAGFLIPLIYRFKPE